MLRNDISKLPQNQNFSYQVYTVTENQSASSDIIWYDLYKLSEKWLKL